MADKELKFRQKMAKLNFFDLEISKDSISVKYIFFDIDKKPDGSLVFQFDIENDKICLYDERYYKSLIRVPDYCIQLAFKYIHEFLKGE